MEEKEITKEDYQILLEEHDWWFEMSDDFRVWEKGHLEQIKLKSLAASNPEFKEMFLKRGNFEYKSV